MNDRPSRFLWFLLVATLIWSGCMQIQINGYGKSHLGGPPSCTYFSSSSPIVNVELAGSPTCFENLLAAGSKGSGNAKLVRTNTRMDLVFVALYWTTFILLAASQPGGWPMAVMSFISVSALFDCLENYRILEGVRQYLANATIEGPAPRSVSMVKWLALAVALATLGKVFWDGGGRWSRIHGAVLVLAGGLTIPAVWFPDFLTPAVMAFLAVFILALVRYFPFTWEQTVLAIEYAYLMRFQITAGLLLSAGFPAAYYFVPSVFQGLFDGRGFWSFTFIVWAAFQLAWTIMVTCRLVLVYGPERFGRAKPIGVGRVGTTIVVGFGLLAVPATYVLAKQTILLHRLEEIPGIALGMAMALLVLMATAAMHFAIEPEQGTNASAVFPSFGFLSSRLPGLSAPSFWRFAKKCLLRLPPDVTTGIVKDGRIHSGHEMATISLLVFLGIYTLLGFVYSPTRVVPEKQPAALFFMFFLLTVLTWLFSGAAFLLDRFRLPVFITLLLASLVTGTIGTDHQFKIAPQTATEPLSASTVVQRWIAGDRRKDSKTLVVVATAGGGIRAAAWTAEVLTQLQKDNGCGPKLSSSMILISSVSGGSVGAMFALAPYLSNHGDFRMDDGTLESVRFNARRSSLSAVGWGFLYPDLARTVPLLGTIAVPEWLDRGWSLQTAWETGWRETNSRVPTLVAWRKDVARGVRPAVIFNATTSESGQRFLTSSTDLSDTAAVQFFNVFPDRDVSVATAARLSATFPYVSPETRASAGKPEMRYHVADGGYYDNSGVLSAIEWLQDAWNDGTTKKALEGYNVVIIIIDAKPGNPPEGKGWSWQRQMVGPIETLLNVRSSSQSVRDDLELNMALDFLRNQGVNIGKPAKFLYDPYDQPVPLSWHLTDEQLHAITANWEGQSDAADLVYEQLGCKTRPGDSQKGITR
jgi:Patatin-like phospholipase